MKASTPIILSVFFLLLLAGTVLAATQILRVQETDLVKLKVEATDPDGDPLTFAYSPPLNADGEWQTGYNDSGEYDITITAKDKAGLTSSKKIKLMVENKNRPPELPTNKIIAKEGELVNLKNLVRDPDEDPLNFVFEAPFDKKGEWTPTYLDEGNFVTKLIVSDGQDKITARVEIEVPSINHNPSITNSFDQSKIINYKENENIKFYVEAEDVDNDKLAYHWEFDGKNISDESSDKYYLDYDSAGKHSLAVSVSDGKEAVKKEWIVNVENTNRKPKLVLLPITVKEGERVKVKVPGKDDDGDWLTYSFEHPLDQNGEWQTGYNDAGKHVSDVTAFDGKDKTKSKIEINVINADRSPAIILPGRIDVNEGEKGFWHLDINDPDGDVLEVKFKNLPEGAVFDQKTKNLTWTPSYATIKRSGGKISDLLNKLRLEHYLLSKKYFSVTVTSCAKELCTSKNLMIAVHNVNRAPVIQKFSDLNVTEENATSLAVSAIDPDGDIVHYYFTKPLGLKSGSWKTKYGDKGIHTAYVTATDGYWGQTVPVTIKVAKNNRAPTLKIKKDNLVVNERQQFMFAVSAADPDNDAVNIKLEGMPSGASFKDGIFLWQPGYNLVSNKTLTWRNSFLNKYPYLNKKFSHDETVIWLNFKGSDGMMEVSHPVKVTIKNINRSPQIIKIVPEEGSTVKIGQPVKLQITAQDEDKDQLNYHWDFGWGQGSVSGSNLVERTFSTSGEKKIKVAVSDGFTEVEKELTIKVMGEQKEETTVSPPTGIEELPFTIKIYVVKFNSTG